MSDEATNGASQPSMTSLMSGILADVQQLMAQQSQMLRLEIRDDLRKARTGMIFLGAGLGVTAVGGLLLCFMLPLLLHWLSDWPEWVCFGSVGVLLLLLGSGVTYTAVQKFQDAAALPKSTATLKENMACLLRRN